MSDYNEAQDQGDCTDEICMNFEFDEDEGMGIRFGFFSPLITRRDDEDLIDLYLDEEIYKSRLLTLEQAKKFALDLLAQVEFISVVDANFTPGEIFNLSDSDGDSDE